MYALFGVCNALSPTRLDDNIANIAKERFGEQYAKITRGGQEALSAFEELFIYACPKFIGANPPPYDDPVAINALLAPSSPPDSSGSGYDATQRHLSLFLADVAAQLPVPTLKSFLKLYTSLDAKKLANFLDADEEEMVQEMMVMKQASKSLSRVPGMENAGLLDGQVTTMSDLNFVIDDNMVHITESTVGRRYAGWFIKNTERAQKIFDDLRHMPLPIASANKSSITTGGTNPGPTASATSAPGPGGSRETGEAQAQTQGQAQRGSGSQRKVAWGGVRA